MAQQEQSAPAAAPPEPFVIGSAQPSSVGLGTTVSLIKNVFSTPERPAGLDMAKLPTFGERLTSYLGSFALFAGTKAASEAPAPPPPPPSAPVDFDFDNDGLSDRGRWHRNPTEFKVRKSSDGNYLTYTLGSSSAVAAPGDYNGDGNTDAGVFLNGTWTYKTSTGGSAQTMNWGTTGDKPVPGRYDSDSSTDFAIWRPGSTGYWYVYKSSDSNWYSVAIGTTGDIPAVGDFDGDGLSDQAVFRPSNGNWYIVGSTAGSYTFHWGTTGDIPVAADFDGDGKTDPAVYRPSTGYWYAYKSGVNNGSYTAQAWGTYGDQPVPGYYDGDNKADFAIWRPTTGAWYTINSTNSSYSYELLGVPGDQAVPSAYIPQVGSTVPTDQVAKERLAPKNATGGTNLYSGNFGWGTGLVGLPGRSGLDMGFGLSYNSLIWLKVGNTMVFDPDNSNISPGFRFGFPTIEPTYYDDDKDVWAYMMVAPSGARTEFRQTGVSNVYDTADSTYTQLVTTGATNPNDPVEAITIKVTNSDGTQMSYVWKAGAFRCTQIKDRNGNYITITHNDYGDLETVTDTLGRVITVNYSGERTPSSITQTWKGTNGSGSNITHTWASFAYTAVQIDTDFVSGGNPMPVFGPPNGTYINVLQKVTRSDGSYTTFDYTTWGQVKQINNYSSNDNKLNHIAVNLPADTGWSGDDCPRFSQTKTYAQNFNSGNEVTFNHTKTTGQSYSLPGSISGTATLIQTWMSSHPDNLRTNTFIAESGWKEGLPVATEDCITTSATCTTRKRWTWTDWTQDNTSAAYPINPRSIESRVGDATNTKRSTTEYYLYSSTTVAIYGLVKEEIEYKADLSNTEKKAVYEYDLDTDYTNRRILGVPFATYLYGYGQENSSLNLVSKLTYGFDEGNFSDSGLSQNISPTQHDSTNYSSSFISGRANLTSLTRWDATAPTTSGSAVTSSVKYNTAGSVVSKTDARGRVSKISYADDWNDNVSRTTYAYPTAFTDSGNNSSTHEYRYDMGTSVWSRSPTPYDSAGGGNPYGKTTTRTYDDTTGLLTKNKIENNGAYTRYAYGSDGITFDTYTTIVDANSDTTINGSDEIQTTTLTDGAGRIRKTRTENPNSTGGYTGTMTEYNILGQAWRSTVPTEVNSSWNPAGDDYRGMTGSDYNWLWSSAEFDWKGRVTRQINTDGTDRLFSYDGCGCAGQVTTIQSEVTEALDVSGSMQTTKRRTQKFYEDHLGRLVKAEMWDLDGAGSTPYKTAVNSYNGRDQITQIRQYAGGTSSGTYQDSTMSFDGHGRLASSHRPEQFDHNNSDAATYSTYTYHADDSIATKTDPRGATTTFKYGNIDDSSSEYRPLLTKMTYSVPGGSSIPVPGDVTFTYDPAGNRKTMTDDTGTLAYTYDQLSLLKTETKDFADTLTNAPSGGVYTLAYQYHLTGGLKSIEDPFGSVVTYPTDKIGRTTGAGGAGFFVDSTEVTSYATNVAYRAFGSIKSLQYSTGAATNTAIGYDNRLRPSTYVVSSSISDIHDREYTYNNDDTLKEASDELETNFTQFNDYDFAGRLKRNEFGTGSAGAGKPYKQTLIYDEFDNITSRSTKSWAYAAANASNTYSKGRKVSGGGKSYTYDIAGNTVAQAEFATNTTMNWTFDAGGAVSAWTETAPYIGALKDTGEYITADGDGRKAKLVDRNRNRNISMTWYEENKYAIFSSVTSQKIAELDSDGSKEKGFVYLGNTLIAEQWKVISDWALFFRNADPVTGSQRTIDTAGETYPNASIWRSDIGGLGVEVPPAEEEIAAPMSSSRKLRKAFNADFGCEVDGLPSDCSALERGVAVPCPDNDCGPRSITIQAPITGRHTIMFGPYQTLADGTMGFPVRSARDQGILQGFLIEAGIAGKVFDVFDLAMNFVATDEKKKKKKKDKKKAEKEPDKPWGPDSFRHLGVQPAWEVGVKVTDGEVREKLLDCIKTAWDGLLKAAKELDSVGSVRWEDSRNARLGGLVGLLGGSGMGGQWAQPNSAWTLDLEMKTTGAAVRRGAIITVLVGVMFVREAEIRAQERDIRKFGEDLMKYGQQANDCHKKYPGNTLSNPSPLQRELINPGFDINTVLVH